MLLTSGPFNFPLLLTVSKVAPALAAGNTIAHKPASSTPLSALKLASIIREAGIPDGVYNTVTGPGGEVGNRLASRMTSAAGKPPSQSPVACLEPRGVAA